MGSSFEANAQSLRIVASLEVKYDSEYATPWGDKERVGLNLTMETLAASMKYPWAQYKGAARRRDTKKFGYYEEEANVASLALATVLPETPDVFNRKRKHAAAEIVDWADDVAFSVHDLEDGIRAGLVPLDYLLRAEAGKERTVIVRLAREHAKNDKWPNEAPLTTAELTAAMMWLKSYRRLKRLREPYVRQDRQRGYLKEMTTSLIDVLTAGLTAGTSEPLHTAADLDRSRQDEARMAILKAINWHYVINSRALQTMQYRERRIVTSLCDALLTDGGVLLPEERRPAYKEGLEKDVAATGKNPTERAMLSFLRNERAQLPHWDGLPKEVRAEAPKVARARVVCDYVSGMTDSFAERSYARLAGFEAQAVSDFV
jgi:dGTPase